VFHQPNPEEDPVFLTHHPRYTQIKHFLKVVCVLSDLFVKDLSHHIDLMHHRNRGAAIFKILSLNFRFFAVALLILCVYLMALLSRSNSLLKWIYLM